MLENIPNPEIFTPLKDLVGEDNAYNHLHWVRVGKTNEREAVPNSISISGYVRNEWIKDAPSLGKNHVLYNGIDIEKFSNSFHYRIETRDELGIHDNDIIVIFCGRFMPEKGIKELLRAFDLIEDKRIKLLLLGSANYSFSAETNFSRMIIDKAKQMNTVIYLGYVPNDSLPKYYGAADIMTVPSVWQEGAGIVTIEGMASGLPLIITQSGGMVEYVSDECAIKLPIDSELSNNLAKSIIELSENSSLREKMGKASKKKSSKLFIRELL